MKPIRILDYDRVNPERELTTKAWRIATIAHRFFSRIPCVGEEIADEHWAGIVRHVHWSVLENHEAVAHLELELTEDVRHEHCDHEVSSKTRVDYSCPPINHYICHACAHEWSEQEEPDFPKMEAT